MDSGLAVGYFRTGMTTSCRTTAGLHRTAREHLHQAVFASVVLCDGMSRLMTRHRDAAAV
jgi:hypothetical protein